jgi:hypothetical protein
MSIKTMLSTRECDSLEAINGFQHTLEFANALKKENSSGGIGLFKKSKIPDVRNMTRLDRHIDLCIADSHLYKNLVLFLVTKDISIFSKDAQNLKSAFQYYLSSYNYLLEIFYDFSETGFQKFKIFEQYLSGSKYMIYKH